MTDASACVSNVVTISGGEVRTGSGSGGGSVGSIGSGVSNLVTLQTASRQTTSAVRWSPWRLAPRGVVPAPEAQERELLAAGWEKVGPGGMWKSPWGSLYAGAYQAWKAKRKRG
jgi:hypothetical protein